MSTIHQLVGFKVDKEFLGAPIEKVKEIVRVPDITAVPDTPVFLKGVINLRGRIVPVIELSKRLSGGSTTDKKSNRILVLEIGKSMIGLLVDSVSEILKLPEESIEPQPELVTSVGGEYVCGLGKLKDRLVVLLDLDKLLSPDEMKRIMEVESRASDEINGEPEGEPMNGLDGLKGAGEGDEGVDKASGM